MTSGGEEVLGLRTKVLRNQSGLRQTSNVNTSTMLIKRTTAHLSPIAPRNSEQFGRRMNFQKMTESPPPFVVVVRGDSGAAAAMIATYLDISYVPFLF